MSTTIHVQNEDPTRTRAVVKLAGPYPVNYCLTVANGGKDEVRIFADSSTLALIRDAIEATLTGKR